MTAKVDKAPAQAARHDAKRMDRQLYEHELYRLQAELVKMQAWVSDQGARVMVVFEGRDAAGKGGTIKRVTQYLNPRVAGIVALGAPTEREQTQWYFQRYIEHLPAGGQIALFDRSWYNRAGVEHVMGFCTKEEYHRFLHQCPIFERLLVEDGILLRKYWFSVSDEEQEKRLVSRLEDPLRQWKLSGLDLQSISLSFQRRAGLPARSWKRRSCSSSLTENQYFSRMMPERMSIRSNSGQECKNSVYSS